MRKFIIIGILLLPYSLILNNITFYHNGYIRVEDAKSNIERKSYDSIYYHCLDYIQNNIDTLTDVYKSSDFVAVSFENYEVFICNDGKMLIQVDGKDVMILYDSEHYKLMLKIMEKYK